MYLHSPRGFTLENINSILRFNLNILHILVEKKMREPRLLIKYVSDTIDAQISPPPNRLCAAYLASAVCLLVYLFQMKKIVCCEYAVQLGSDWGRGLKILDLLDTVSTSGAVCFWLKEMILLLVPLAGLLVSHLPWNLSL